MKSIIFIILIIFSISCKKKSETHDVIYNCYSVNTPYRFSYQTQDGIETYTIQASNYSKTISVKAGTDFNGSITNISNHTFDSLHIQLLSDNKQANDGLSFSNAIGSVKVTSLQLK